MMIRRRPHISWSIALAFSFLALVPLAGCYNSSGNPPSMSLPAENGDFSDSDFLYENVTNTKATLGRKATLKCTAENMSGKKMISWVRYRDVSLLAVGKFVYISDDRFKVLHEPHSDDWFLVIRSVNYDDEGIYECQINAQPADSVSKKYMLTVVEPRTEIVGESELFVDFASSLNLTCLVLSPDPPSYVFWKKDEKALVEASESSHPDFSRDNIRILFSQHNPHPGATVSSLLIHKVNRTHNGLFTCVPSNSEAKSIRVHVLKDDSQPAAIHTTTSAATTVQRYKNWPSLLLVCFFLAESIS